jgi:Tn3 transposase DDE domain
VLDPRRVYTLTYGYTEVAMATGALLGTALAPRIAHMHELGAGADTRAHDIHGVLARGTRSALCPGVVQKSVAHGRKPSLLVAG